MIRAGIKEIIDRHLSSLMNAEHTHLLWSKLASATARKIDLKSFPSVVSFTFDDAPLSAFIKGGGILEKYGYRGTYYVSGGLIGSSTAVGKVPDLNTIWKFHNKGHEIGNHTYDHLDCKKAGLLGVLRSILRNRRMLAEGLTGSFSYPYGAVDGKARFAARLSTTSARGISYGINRNVIDLMNLKAVKVYDRFGIAMCLDLIEECAAKGGWLIFYTHDVCDEPSNFGCTEEQLTRLVQVVHDHKLTIAPVRKALQLIEHAGKRKGLFRKMYV